MTGRSFLILCALMITSSGYAEEKLNVAVADFSGRGVSAADAVAISDFFRIGLVNTKVHNVLDRNNMEVILGEQRNQMSGCTEQGCAVKLGKMLNVQKMIVGTVSVFDDTYYINAQVIDVEKGVIETSKKIGTTVKRELPDKAEALAFEIAGLGKQPAAAAAGQEVRNGNLSRSVAGGEDLAVFNFRAKKVPVEDASMVSELIRAELANTGKYNVMGKARMTEIYTINKFSVSDQDLTGIGICQKLAMMLKVKDFVFGTLSKSGDNYSIKAALVETKTRRIYANYGADDVSGAELKNACARLAAEIANTDKTKKEELQ